jgi:Fe-S cluster assembly iron-binding protein IscA
MSILLISQVYLIDYIHSILEHPSSPDAALVIDAVSLPLLNGSLVDFATELIGSSFRVVDNPNATGKGCGCGVSWELKA